MHDREDADNIFDDLPTKSENLYDQINILATDGTLQTYCSWSNTTVKNGNAIPNFNFSVFCMGDHFSVIEKSISVAETGDVTFGILGKKIDSQQLNITPATIIDDFINSLKKFEDINVCHEGPSVNNFPKAPTSLCVVNTLGRLQHLNCNVILNKNNTSCIRCQKLGNILRMREKRKQYDGQDQLLLSSSKLQKINKIRNQNKGLKRKIVRTKVNIKN